MTIHEITSAVFFGTLLAHVTVMIAQLLVSFAILQGKKRAIKLALAELERLVDDAKGVAREQNTGLN